MIQTYPEDYSWIRLLVAGMLILILIFCAFRARASPITEIKQLDWYAESSQIYINRQTGCWADGKTATIIDVGTGISFQAVRYRGTNHADYEPATRSDAESLQSIYGRWSWDRRPVIVLIAGEAFAASMNGMPHGKASIKDNGYPGHSCIHFLNSKTHGGNQVDKKHQEAVQTAYNTNLQTLNILISKGCEPNEVLVQGESSRTDNY